MTKIFRRRFSRLNSAVIATTSVALTIGVGGFATDVPAAASEPSTRLQSAARESGISVCSGIKGCKVVAHRDIDGDHRADAIGVVAKNLSSPGHGQVKLIVRTATGKRLTTTSKDVFWFGGANDVWLGAAPIDGVRGAEMVIGQSLGAHYEQFRVVTYRSGKLVTLRAPKLPGKAGNGPTSVWGIDSAYSFEVGISRKVKHGSTYVTVKSADRNTSGHGHSGWTSEFRWRNGWKLVSIKRAHYSTDSAAGKVGGWHVKGLPRFA